MDIEEYCAIEDYKQGQPKRLLTLLASQKGKLSPLLQTFIPEMEKRTFRKRGGQKKPWRKGEIKIAIITAEVEAKLKAKLHGLPSSKKAILLDAATMTHLKLKRVERVAYPKSSNKTKSQGLTSK